jgi:uncharacterized membrane protein
MSNVLLALAFCAALGCGLMAGVFLAFSSFVMSGLARLPAPQGIAAMQSINVRAITPVFMTVFLGTTVVCALLGVLTLISRPVGAGYLLTGSLSYVVGSFLVTIVCNVPRNNRLAAANPEAAAAARLWTDYLRTWTAWNHLRTIASLVATALLTFWLCQQQA